MAKYIVKAVDTYEYIVEVEADSYKEAVDKTLEAAICEGKIVCCSNTDPDVWSCKKVKKYGKKPIKEGANIRVDFSIF